MSITYGFYNSLNHDRRYDAKQFSQIFDGIINDGVYMSIGEKFVVKANGGMTVSVGTGRAWFDGTWTLNDAPYLIDIDEAEVILDRIDAIVLEVNTGDTVRANSIKVIKGTPASSPARPELVKDIDVNQYALGYVRVVHETNQITQSNITNMVGTSGTPFVTGIIDVMEIDDIVAQWQTEFREWNDQKRAEFNVWFDSIKDILDESIATKLQVEIDNLNAAIAPVYNPVRSTQYTVGEYTMHNNLLYICTSPTSGEFNPSKWTLKSVMGVISDDLKSKAMFYPSSKGSNGYVLTTDGNNGLSWKELFVSNNKTITITHYFKVDNTGTINTKTQNVIASRVNNMIFINFLFVNMGAGDTWGLTKIEIPINALQIIPNKVIYCYMRSTYTSGDYYPNFSIISNVSFGSSVITININTAKHTRVTNDIFSLALAQ